MLVRINSSTSGDMIMFAEHLRLLYDIVGKECSARGVFTHDQLPDAIARLKAAVAAEKQALHEAEQRAREDGNEPEEVSADENGDPFGRVHLGQRAAPLVHLMEWTLKEKRFILWEAEHDF